LLWTRTHWCPACSDRLARVVYGLVNGPPKAGTLLRGRTLFLHGELPLRRCGDRQVLGPGFS